MTEDGTRQGIDQAELEDRWRAFPKREEVSVRISQAVATPPVALAQSDED
jgi:hypothetical protein